jgi:hypothetical protein
MFVLLMIVTTVAAVRGMWSPCGLSMLSSLNPVAERARGHRFWVTACWYAAGAAVGGALLGIGCALGAGAARAAGAAGVLDLGGAARWSFILCAALLAVLSDASLVSWSLPMHPRQVDERWLTKYRRWIYAGGYGAQIGTGFATYIMSAAVYLTVALAVLTAAPREAFTAGVLFGVVRGSSIMLAAMARDPERLRVVAARVDALGPISAGAALLVCAGVAVAAATELVGWPGGAIVAAACAGAEVAPHIGRRRIRRARRRAARVTVRPPAANPAAVPPKVSAG